MRKRIIIIFGIVIILTGSFYIYINSYFLPVQLKQIIATKAEDFLGRKITYSEIEYHPIKGMIIKDLTIFHKNNPQSPFVNIKETKFKVLLSALLKNRKLYIPSISMDSPYIHVIKQEESWWNFSDLLGQRRKSDSRPESLFLGKLLISNGRVVVTDQTREKSTQVFDNIQVQASLSAKKGVDFKLKCLIPHDAPEFAQIQDGSNSLSPHPGPEDGFIESEGNYAVTTGQLTSQVRTQNLDLAKYLKYAKQNSEFKINKAYIKNCDFAVQYKNKELTTDGILAASIDLEIYLGVDKLIKADINATNLKLHKKGKQVKVTTSLQADDADFLIGGNKSIKGNISSKFLTITADGRNVWVEGDLDSNNTTIVVLGNVIINAPLLSARDMKYSIINEDVTLHADMFTPKGQIEFGEGNLFKGNVILQNVIFHRVDNNYDAGADVELQNTRIKIGSKLALSGNIKTEGAAYTYKDRIFQFQTPSFDLQKTSMIILENKFLKGNISGREIAVSVMNPDNKTDIKGKLFGNEIAYRFGTEKDFLGSPEIVLKINFDPQAKTPLTYSGTARLNDAGLTNIPRVGEISGIHGVINFQTEQFNSQSLDLTAWGSDINVSGNVININDPVLDLQATSKKIDVNILPLIFPEFFERTQIQPSGSTSAKVAYRGKMKSPPDAEIKVITNLRDAALNDLKTPARFTEPITNISGAIRYDNKSMAWSSLVGKYKGTNYFLSGKLDNILNPTIKTTLNSKNINLDANFKILPQALTINTLIGTFYRSAFNLSGDIELKENNNHRLNLKYTGDLELTDLILMRPSWRSNLKKWKPAGVVSIKGLYRGNMQKWYSGTIRTTASSPLISLNDVKLTDLDLSINETRDNRSYTNLTLNGKFYDGDLTVTGVADAKKPSVPILLSTKAENVNLKKLIKDTQWKDRDIAGELSAGFNINGSPFDPGSIEGTVAYLVQDGYLGSVNLLKGIWGLLLIPEFENINFTTAQARYDIQNRKATTKNLYLKSTPLELYGEGWIDFDKNIEFDITADFNQAEILRSNSVLKVPTTLITQAQNYVGIKIKGTLNQPRFEKVLRPPRVIRKTTGAVWNLFEELLEQIPVKLE